MRLMEQVTGLEPVPSAWQAEILTDYTIPAFMEPMVRLKLTATRLQVESAIDCATSAERKRVR